MHPQALIYSAEISGVKTEHLRSVAVSTYGIFFLGTPHKGSDLGQWGSYLESLCNAIIPKKLLDSQPHLLEALKTNSETLQNVDRQFSMLMDQYHLFFFHEGKPTDFKGTYHFVSRRFPRPPYLHTDLMLDRRRGICCTDPTRRRESQHTGRPLGNVQI